MKDIKLKDFIPTRHHACPDFSKLPKEKFNLQNQPSIGESLQYEVMFEYCEGTSCAPDDEIKSFLSNIMIYYQNPDTKISKSPDNNVTVEVDADHIGQKS